MELTVGTTCENDCNERPFFSVRLVIRSLAIVLRWNPLNSSPEKSLRYKALLCAVVVASGVPLLAATPPHVKEVLLALF